MEDKGIVSKVLQANVLERDQYEDLGLDEMTVFKVDRMEIGANIVKWMEVI